MNNNNSSSSAGSSIGDTIVSSSVVLQQTNSSTTYEFTQWMSLKDCMDFLVTKIGIENPINGSLAHTFSRLWKYEIGFRDDLLIDYSGIFKSNIVLIALNDNVPTDNNSISTISNETTYKQNIFLLFHEGQQLFAVYVSYDDNIPKVCFDDNDKEVLSKNISASIAKWNDSISRNKENNINNDDVVVQYQPASKAIRMRLEILLELISRVDDKFEKAKLKNESLQAVLNEFNRLNDKEKMKIIESEFANVSNDFQMAKSIYHEQAKESSVIEAGDQRSCCDPADAIIDHNRSVLPIEQNLPKTTDMKSNAYGALQILEEPNRYQRPHTFSELAFGTAAAHPTYVKIEVPSPDGTDLYVRVKAVTVNGLPHPYKAVVPKNTTIDRSKIDTHDERLCLKYDRDQYNPDKAFTYVRITPEERREKKKEIQSHLICWSERNHRFENNKYVSLCKFEFSLCIRTGLGQYQRVSSITHSSVIEEGDGPIEIDENAVQQSDVCVRGGQVIEFPLNFTCSKFDIVVDYNDKQLAEENIKIHGQTLLVTIPAKEENHPDLHLTIYRNEDDDTNEDFMNRILFHRVFNYVSHDTLGLHSCA